MRVTTRDSVNSE